MQKPDSDLECGVFVEVDGLLAVVVGSHREYSIPESHVALWFGEPRTTRISKGGSGGASAQIWAVPKKVCVTAQPAKLLR